MILAVPPPADLTATATLILAAIALGLALATVALVVVTRQGTAQARAVARAELAALERQVSAGHRPLLVDVLVAAPVPDDMPVMSRGETPTAQVQLPGMPVPALVDPRHVLVRVDGERVYVSVPLRNVGHGLAVLEDVGVSAEGPGLGELEHRGVQRRHVPVNETTRVELVAINDRDDRIANGTHWRIGVPYRDFAGQQRTIALVSLVCRGDDAQGPWAVERVEQQPEGEHVERREREPDREPPVAAPPAADSPPRTAVSGQPLTNIWGQPITPRRRNR